MTLLDLFQQSGYKVKIRHNRYYGNIPSPLSEKEAEKEGYFLKDCHAKGGLTEVSVYKQVDDPIEENFAAEKPVASTVALCSQKDAYCRKIGREIALGRIKKELSL